MLPRFKFGILVGVLIAAAAATNPDRDQHARKLSEAALSPLAEGGDKSLLTRIGGAFAESFSDVVVDYHNYGLFSTTTRPGSDERMSIGAFGQIYVVEGDR